MITLFHPNLVVIHLLIRLVKFVLEGSDSKIGKNIMTLRINSLVGQLFQPSLLFGRFLCLWLSATAAKDSDQDVTENTQYLLYEITHSFLEEVEQEAKGAEVEVEDSKTWGKSCGDSVVIAEGCHHAHLGVRSSLIVFKEFIIRWNDLIVGKHESTDQEMDNNTEFEESNGHVRKRMVESACLLVSLDEESLINPVEDEIVKTSDGIQDWHSTCVCENRPKRSEILCVNEVWLNLFASVWFLEVLLDELLSIDLIAFGCFPNLSYATSVAASQEGLENCVANLGYMGSSCV